MARIEISESVLRDGLQIEPNFVPTDKKIALLNRLSRLGFARIEVTSFVSPKAVPMLRDAEEVALGFEHVPGIIYAGLVANTRGAQRALDAGMDEIGLVVSASESHNRANVGRTIDASFDGFARIAERVAEHVAGQPKPIRLMGAISMAFGCPFEGDIAPALIFKMIERYRALGISHITLADTTGMAYPNQVQQLCGAALQRYPDAFFDLHFHDTRGLGLANVAAALSVGITRFDGCLGGLGGCPFAPGASGNICTEDLVHMLTLMGHETGVDLDGLIECTALLKEAVGHDLPGQVTKAGPRWRPSAVTQKAD
jgi:hydroxymethylglutaryl-CoA lyase